MPKFLVNITKTTTIKYEQTEVEADNMAEAITLAEDMAAEDELDEDSNNDVYSSTAEDVA